LHSEVLIADQLYRRRDVLTGETLVTQIYTERIPCSECRILLSEIPHFKDVPKYYYLAYHDKAWQRKRGDGNWGVFLMDCYRLRSTVNQLVDCIRAAHSQLESTHHWRSSRSEAPGLLVQLHPVATILSSGHPEQHQRGDNQRSSETAASLGLPEFAAFESQPIRGHAYLNTSFITVTAARYEAVHVHELVYFVQRRVWGPRDLVPLFAAGGVAISSEHRSDSGDVGAQIARTGIP